MKLLVLFLLLTKTARAWVPPGLHDREIDSPPPTADQHNENQQGHHHTRNTEVKDIITDAEHLADDLQEIFTEQQINLMDTDQQLFLWFSSHDWDKDEKMDGLELFKALSHDHNYHHEDDEGEGGIVDPDHDPLQHTPAAERQRFRRTEKIVDKLLKEDDLDHEGTISFPEFVAAFRAGRLDGLKVKKS